MKLVPHCSTVDSRTDLKQLIQAKDFWVPMVLLGAIFFVVVPRSCCRHHAASATSTSVQQVSQALELLPPRPRQPMPQAPPAGARRPYALAVYLFAPVAVVVPLTISTAVGASDDRRRARARHRRVPRPLPRRRPRDLPRQADRQPHPRLRHDDRRVRPLLADRQPDRRPRRRRLVLPDAAVVGADALGAPAVPRAHAVARAAAVGPGEVDAPPRSRRPGLVTLPLIMIAYSQSTGALFGAADAWLR